MPFLGLPDVLGADLGDGNLIIFFRRRPPPQQAMLSEKNTKARGGSDYIARRITPRRPYVLRTVHSHDACFGDA